MRIGNDLRRSFRSEVCAVQLAVEPLGLFHGFRELLHEPIERFLEVHISLDGRADRETCHN